MNGREAQRAVGNRVEAELSGSLPNPIQTQVRRLDIGEYPTISSVGQGTISRVPPIVLWFSRLLPTNPICIRVIAGGSRRSRDLYLRAAYLAIMIAVLLLQLLGSDTTMRQLAQRGANAFSVVSFGQVALIVLLTPVFMAGAIVQEANPRTWDILLSTPLSNMQIVLGNLFGRLFFVLALILSTLPLFILTQFFGGVPGTSIVMSYLVAGSSALFVAATAVTLSVTRTGGKRAVFVFYSAVVMYVFVTYAADLYLRSWSSLGAGTGASYTTFFAPLNPFLALEALLAANTYVPRGAETFSNPITAAWYAYPTATFCWFSILLSVVMVVWSTLRVRSFGRAPGSVSWWSKLFAVGMTGGERESRRVGNNPIAWRERSLRAASPAGAVGRWIFLALGILAALILVGLHHQGSITPQDLRLGLLATVGAEMIVVLLTALNLSATAVSREREDGTLDILLTTPIQPGPYLAGKLQGLVQFLLPMILVPFATLAIASVYVMCGGFNAPGGVVVQEVVGVSTLAVPLIFPEGALLVPLVLVATAAFTVMIGLQWSVKTKGTIGSVIAASLVVFGIGGLLGLCGFTAGRSVPYVGAALSAVSPINLLVAIVDPATAIPESMTDEAAARVSLIVGSLGAVLAYGLAVYAMHAQLKRSFMMTVRRLAGLN